MHIFFKEAIVARFEFFGCDFFKIFHGKYLNSTAVWRLVGRNHLVSLSAKY